MSKPEPIKKLNNIKKQLDNIIKLINLFDDIDLTIILLKVKKKIAVNIILKNPNKILISINGVI